MAATASTRDLTKAIGAFFASPSYPLPDELELVIVAYLTKHEKHESTSTEDRLHDDLRSIYQKHVHKQPPSRIAPFLAILRQLRPVIRSPSKILYWFDFLSEVVLDKISGERDIETETAAGLDALVCSIPDGQEGAADPMTRRTLERWLRLSSLPKAQPATAYKEKVVRESLFKMGRRLPKAFMEALAAASRRKEHRCQAMTLLCEFVQTQPPRLHLAVQTSLFKILLTCLQRDASTTIVTLALTALTMLLPNMPSSLVPYLPDLFNIYARILFWERERALERAGAVPHPRFSDGDSWDIIPYSPESEDTNIPHLVHYFTVLYGLYPINFMDYIRKPQRYLRHANASIADEVEVQPSEIRHRSEKFRDIHRLHPNFYSMTIESEITDFGRWIKSEPAVILAECTALCTLGDSIPGDDQPRLLVPFPGQATVTRDGPSGDDSDKDEGDRALLGGEASLSGSYEPMGASWRHTQSTAVDSAEGSRVHSTEIRRDSQASKDSIRDSLSPRNQQIGADSPTLPPLLVSSPSSRSQVREMIRTNSIVKAGLSQSLANDSITSLSLSLSPHSSTSERVPASMAPPPQATKRVPSTPGMPSAGFGSENNSEIMRLRRQVILLKNDLNFERHMKKQRGAQIGELRRRQLKEAATEAETQTLIMGHRNLKSALEAAKQAEVQTRKDSERSRTVSKKWEADLMAKLKVLRDDQKKKNAEIDALKRELDLTKEECENMRQMVCEGEVREFSLTQTIATAKGNLPEVERLRNEVDRLTGAERDYQLAQDEMAEKLEHAAESEHRAEMLAQKLKALEIELQSTGEQYQSQIVVLNTKLAEALKNSKGWGNRGGASGDSTETAELLRSTMAASRAKQAELQKQYSALMRKYTVLRSSVENKKFSELISATSVPPRSRPSPNEATATATAAEAEVSAMGVAHSPSSYSARTNRLRRGFSDPETFESSPSSSPRPRIHPQPASSLQAPQQLSQQAQAQLQQQQDRQVQHILQQQVKEQQQVQQLHLQEGFMPIMSTGTVYRPTTPTPPLGGGPARAGGQDVPGSTSPQGERYFGRGGVQNTIRKERKDKKEVEKKDKKKADGDKKEKKSGGIRGIRAFI